MRAISMNDLHNFAQDPKLAINQKYYSSPAVAATFRDSASHINSETFMLNAGLQRKQQWRHLPFGPGKKSVRPVWVCVRFLFLRFLLCNVYNEAKRQRTVWKATDTAKVQVSFETYLAAGGFAELSNNQIPKLDTEMIN